MPFTFTILFCSSVWTLVLGHFFFKTPVSRRSIGACIFCVGGIVLVVGFDYGQLKGNLLAVASALLYSAYGLVLRWKSPDSVDVSMSMMFGFVGQFPQISRRRILPPFLTRAVAGLFSFVAFGALLPILHFTHVEVCCSLSKCCHLRPNCPAGVCVARLQYTPFSPSKWLSGLYGQ